MPSPPHPHASLTFPSPFPSPPLCAASPPYSPTLGILIAAVVVFSLETLVLAFLSLRTRTYFLLWIVLFTASEAGGYIGYSIFVQHPSLSGYLAELIILILAPNLVTLVNYTVISRIIPWAGFDVKARIFRYAHWVPIIFVTSDLLCLTIQGIGGSQLSQAHHNGIIDNSKFDLGRNLTLAGISAQLGFQTIFTLLTVYVWRTMPDRELRHQLKWAWVCMLLTMALVYIRNIYRIVEFAGGQHSAVDQTEVPYMVLDLLMMAVCGAVFIVLDLSSDRVLPAKIRYGEKPAAPATVKTVDGQQKTVDTSVEVTEMAPENKV